jgi:hypothetical protein
MPESLSDAEVLGSTPTPAAPLANGLDHPDELTAYDEARTQLRREADKAQLRMAVHDLAEGLRGMIRVAPFASVGVAVALGLLFGRRRSRKPAMRRG